MWSSARLLPLVAIAVACNKFDRLLEGTDVFDGTLAVAVASPSVTLAQGKELTLTATVTRTGELKSGAAISVDGVPQGVTATIGSPATSGRVTTADVTLKVAPGTRVGSYLLTVRAHAEPSATGSALLTLTITEAPAFALSVSATDLTIARGGIAPIAVKFTRTNFTEPIALAVSGSGISANFQANPTAGDSAIGMIAVASSTAPGMYSVSLLATANGLTDQTTQLSVTVTSDPIQVIVSPRLATPQGSTVVLPVIVNRGAYSGVVALTAENLPPGVTATFDPSNATGGTATLSLSVGASTVPGAYLVRVRGAGSGVPETMATLELTVTPVNVSLSVAPRDVSVFQGGSSSLATLKIARIGYSGAVALTFEGAPPGLSIAAQPTNPTGDSVTVTIAATASATPGQYDVTVRGTPAGFPVSASATAIVAVTIRAAPPGGGNVVLDWSRCAAPDWVAYQDGATGWTQAPVASGVSRFTIASSRGGIAYVEGGSIVSVRFGLQAELIDKPFNMCAPVPATKTITGFASMTSTLDQMSFRMGGAATSATGSAPSFTLVGVEEGLQDLVGWGQLALFGRRGILRRDLNPAAGTSLGTLDPLGIESFVPEPASLTPGGAVAGDQISHTMNYLTTPACTVNPLYQATFTAMLGVPSGIQRPTDYHMVSLVATAGTRQRTANLTFHTIANRSLALPPIPSVPVVAPIAGAPYRRLQAFVNTLAPAYNGTAALRYNDGSSRTMSVSASVAYLAAVGSTLAMPSFSGVSGWLNTWAVDANASGTWVVSLDGGTPGPTCSEGKITYVTTQTGRY